MSTLLTFRTAGNKMYKAEFDLSQTVQSVKASLAETQNCDLAKMRLIFKGKVLPDSRTLTEAGVDGTGFIVLHAAPPSAAARAPVKEHIPENSPVKVVAVAEPKPEAPRPPPALSDAPIPLPRRAPHPSLPGFEAKLENLIAMGFPLADCEAALRASLGNVDRAADFLLSGFVPELPQMISTTDVPVSDSDEDSADDDYDEEDEQSRVRRFTRFRDQLIRDPALLRSFLNQMAQDNPGIARMIRDDPAAFLASIGLNPADFNLQGLGRTTQYEDLMSGFSAGEKASIRALEQLGFDTMTIIQVFVACDKDEKLAQECLQSMQ